ncbi:Clavaminate synthase-like protein [Neurospora crassa]|uniref:Oxidoreductase n=2 Tax=Neurospora crassa TaxID=5141 RepID=Q1K6N3_NEUCR|nr:oxidoreductase [Neurospora crassa OR74A]EAA31480.1 oxidoreductase [Neurospora crassa OR74A]KHE80812.1 Clavaminate synthase-like protein [Neurospora crassa]CAB88641.2 conserved hypothetical protein [Neurospora crassa]|eukprot:XP_960716.1 oxidoreductase [Neurospora crassa OR74A]
MTGVAKIPVIDISNDNQDQARVAKDLVEAAIEHGFIYIKNTGKDIPVEDVDAAFELARKLFKETPVEEKQACTIQKNNRGWSAMHYETLDPKNQRVGDFKEAFNFGEPSQQGSHLQQPIPPTIRSAEPFISRFHTLCHHLSLRLNTLLGQGLSVSPPDFFTSAHLRENGASGTILRLLYYPPAPSSLTAEDKKGDGDDVRAGAHSDYGSMTLLFRLKGQAGLEIQTREGNWVPVPVCPPGTETDPAPPILVNIGDLLSYWTNGLLRSTVHRVVFPGAAGSSTVEGETGGEERYSIAYFCHPVGTMKLEPVPSERVRAFGEEQNGKGVLNGERKMLTADEHLNMRLQASYLKLYEDEKKE